MGLTDRFASMLDGIGSTITRVSTAMRNPGVAPEVNIPGVPHWTAGRPNTNERLAAMLRMPEAYMGRVSYDAGPSWTRFSSNPATDLTPQKIIAAQTSAISGYPQVWTEMIEQSLSRDAHLSGIAQQRVDDVIKGSWRLIRATNDDLAAAVRGFCNEALQGIDGFEDDLAWLLWSNAYAYTSGEVIWKETQMSFPGPDGKRIGPIDVIVPRMIDAVHSKHFRFDLRTDEPLLWLGSDQVSLPFGKFLFMVGEGQQPIIERHGYMWPCIWPSMFKAIGWSGWVTHVNRFAMPIPIVEYEGGLAQYEEYKQSFDQILNDLGQGFGVLVPRNDVGVRIENPPSGGSAHDPFSALSDACDASESVRVLGATLTAKIGNVGSFSASTAHLEVKYSREEADARRMWAALRSQLLAPIVYFNTVNLARALGADPDEIRRRVPRGMHRVPREIDPVQRASVVSMAINQWGLEIGSESLFDEFNLPQPLDDSDIARGEPQLISSGGAAVGATEAAKGVEVPKPDTTPGSDQATKQLPAKAETTPEPKKKPEMSYDLASLVMTVDEARALQGLPEIGGKSGAMRLLEYKRKHDRNTQGGEQIDLPFVNPEIAKLEARLEAVIAELASHKVVDPAQQLRAVAETLVDLRKAGIKVDPKEISEKLGLAVKLEIDPIYENG
jgi:phage gp29-like protein